MAAIGHWSDLQFPLSSALFLEVHKILDWGFKSNNNLACNWANLALEFHEGWDGTTETVTLAPHRPNTVIGSRAQMTTYYRVKKEIHHNWLRLHLGVPTKEISQEDMQVYQLLEGEGGNEDADHDSFIENKSRKMPKPRKVDAAVGENDECAPRLPRIGRRRASQFHHCITTRR
ncbi:hypothetical protein CC85DRAFT_300578 [Cutaneotrichosporon oleaginosum]|uniref:Uncharacterized protein n=1 Tax=Cutaneotrichosporon oleaginosum TaxID=879819 RepID=A0A0J0XTQ3_9TREE|nr:uncharacterized protein CC85DRAFT_300578 [Cutaneotrichosporon oleaginosum]KLT44440.1 hypothetical protein CC85DRAFT_300578 [Cutaneotrichosporon oleaginosum]TXT07840.1 hypothetical protein COLE_04764 [Cutaneotrichosporon oleaginosum]